MAISHNTLHDPGPTKHALKFHNEEGLSAFASEFNVISDNDMRGDQITFAYVPQNTNKNEVLRDALIERNVFRASAARTQSHLSISAVNVTVRNNLFLFDGATSFVNGIQTGRGGPEPPVTDLRILNNSFSRADGDNGVEFMCISVRVSDTERVTVKNNVGYWSHATAGGIQGMLKTETALLPQIDSDNNCWLGPGGVFGFVGTPPIFEGKTLADWQGLGLDANSLFADPQFTDPANGDLELGGSSVARGNGQFLPHVRSDFYLRSRTAADPMHVGALQSP
jgi:hypothetical protein